MTQNSPSEPASRSAVEESVAVAHASAASRLSISRSMVRSHADAGSKKTAGGSASAA
jgi:hypothetical protein